MAFSDEELAQCAAVDIVDLAEGHGIELTSETERFYRMTEHDSLVIDRAKNYFHWNSRGFGGNTIKFAQTFLTDPHKTDSARFKDAVGLLLDRNNLKHSEVAYQHTPYVYDPKLISTDFRQAREYLINKRNLSPALVDQFHKEGLAQQNKVGSAVFLWVDPGTDEVMGSTIQGTRIDHQRYGKRGTYKQIERNSTSGYGFAVGPADADTLRFFEAPIDLMSYIQLKGQDVRTQYVAMNGLKEEVITHYLADNIKNRPTVPDRMVFNVDNDAAGQRFVDQFLVLNWTDRRNGKELAVERELPGDDRTPVSYWRDYERASAKYRTNPYLLYVLDKASSNLQPGMLTNGADIHTPFTEQTDHAAATEATAAALPVNFRGSLTQWAGVVRQWNADREGDCQRFGLKCQYYSNQATRGSGLKLIRNSDPFIKDWNDIIRTRVASSVNQGTKTPQEKGQELE
ncbi:DUF3991 domain-containing protein [Schleiferilactobacillus harbinensis]|uniref:DUF3991 domain-containing protein n=1 Tax=Schleiferilactobacillus harbinensis TaxID=304207 RepID=A0A5P8M5L4_9LACO|nr:DUF3991 domain-containing protein [Schleiferilactobacillus harbinensis]QFR23627.1 DUF3991 domain-containing protein [Schleiferilactobacillus harbinensis]